MQIEAHEVDKIRKRMNAPLTTREIMPTRADKLWVDFRGELNVILKSMRKKIQSYDEQENTDEAHQLLFTVYKNARETLDEEWQSFLSKIDKSPSCLQVATDLHEALKNKTAAKTFVHDAVKQWIVHVKNIWYNFSLRKRQTELEKWKQDGFDSLEEAWKKFAVQLEEITSPQQFEKILAEAQCDPNPIFRRFVNALCENKKNLENTVQEWIKRSQSLWNNYRKWTKLYPAAQALVDVQTASFLTSMHDHMELANTLVDLQQLTRREETAHTLGCLERLFVERKKQENMIQSRLKRKRSSADAANLMIQSMSKKFKADTCSLRAHRQNAQNEIEKRKKKNRVRNSANDRAQVLSRRI
jgi:hypothetical protein